MTNVLLSGVARSISVNPMCLKSLTPSAVLLLAAIVFMVIPLSDDNSFRLLDRIASRSFASASNTSSSKLTQALPRAMLRLASPRQREVLQRLYGFDTYGCGTLSDAHKEVGHELGISRGAASYHATMARKQLRADAELCEAVGVEPQPLAMKPREAPTLPEVTYAKELAAWKAGHTSYGSMAKALGYPKWKAQWHMTKMRAAGLIPERKVPVPTSGVV